MSSQPLLGASCVMVTLLLLQLGLITLRTSVRGHLLCATSGASRPVADSSARRNAVLHLSTRHSGDPSPEE